MRLSTRVYYTCKYNYFTFYLVTFLLMLIVITISSLPSRSLVTRLVTSTVGLRCIQVMRSNSNPDTEVSGMKNYLPGPDFLRIRDTPLIDIRQHGQAMQHAESTSDARN